MKLSEYKTFQRISVIYGIQCKNTLKWYIGSCMDMRDRFQRHVYYLRHNLHHSVKLQRAYNLYGEDAFDVTILCFIENKEERFTLEQRYIEEYDSADNGYNMLKNCIYTDNFSFSEKAMDNFLAYIKTLEKSVIAINRKTGIIEGNFESISAAASFYKTSTSNISRVCKGTLHYIKDRVFVYTKDFDENRDYRVEHHCKGKPKPISQRLKMSSSSNRHCEILKYDKNNNLIATYFSIKEAANKGGFNADWLRDKINKNKEINGFKYVRKQNIL